MCDILLWQKLNAIKKHNDNKYDISNLLFAHEADDSNNNNNKIMCRRILLPTARWILNYNWMSMSPAVVHSKF